MTDKRERAARELLELAEIDDMEFSVWECDFLQDVVDRLDSDEPITDRQRAQVEQIAEKMGVPVE